MCSNVMENGIKLTATLESQSPMIHFQARETGAVLRASEVKPKLCIIFISNTRHTSYNRITKI